MGEQWVEDMQKPEGIVDGVREHPHHCLSFDRVDDRETVMMLETRPPVVIRVLARGVISATRNIPSFAFAASQVFRWLPGRLMWSTLGRIRRQL
jgi:hypothetical protein